MISIKKIAAIAAALATIATMSITASAADWSQCSYADNDPSTVKIISLNDDGVTFTTSTKSTDICKARITLDKILKNPDDYSKIAKMTWTVTYSIPDDFEAESLSGGTYATNKNSDGYTIRADGETENTWKDTTYTIDDQVEFTDKTPEKDGEMVFMDWSYADIGSKNVSVTISNYKIFDADGNEIEQIAYGEYGAEEVIEQTAEETTAAPASDNLENIQIEDNAKTGSVAPIIAVSALALSASTGIALSKKSKNDR